MVVGFQSALLPVVLWDQHWHAGVCDTFHVFFDSRLYQSFLGFALDDLLGNLVVLWVAIFAKRSTPSTMKITLSKYTLSKVPPSYY